MSRLQELGLCQWCRNSLDRNGMVCQSCLDYAKRTGQSICDLIRSNIVPPRVLVAIERIAEVNKASQEYEYQVSVERGFIGGNSPVTQDPKEAGNIYRESCKHLQKDGSGTVELKRRKIIPWEVVESTKV